MKLKQFGLIGLGVMGRNLAQNFLDKGVTMAVYNRQVAGIEVDVAKRFAIDHPHSEGFDDWGNFVASLETPRKMLIMVNAGKAVDTVLEGLLPHLSKGDVIMDGGNSHFLDTQRRQETLSAKGILYLGIGISGGEEGARRGPSIVPGGSLEAYHLVAPFLEKITAKDKSGKPCCTYAGPGGAGHFVKMIHNGIEYAEMQILAEVYTLLRHFIGYTPEKIAALLKQWQEEGEGSFLLEITQHILHKKENGELLLDKIVDAAEQKGTGGWSTKAALDLTVPLDSIYAAVSARISSAAKARRVETSKHYAGLSNQLQVQPFTTQDLKSAYIATRILNHAIGINTLLEASIQYNWGLNLSEVARIWTNGCIIRSELIAQLSNYLQTEEQLLVHPEIVKKLTTHWPALAQVVSKGLQKGIALPVMSSSLNYFLSATTANSPANLIQAQRDYFGAHTYKRVDGPDNQYFHTNWAN